jgi:hypothetical protein
LTRLDAGCSFRPRCRFAVADYAAARPPLEPAGNAHHLAACFRSRDIGIEKETATATAPAQRVDGVAVSRLTT